MPEPDEAALARPQRLALLGAWLASTGAFLWSLLSATSGHFVPQVADLYVVAQYARALGEGHPFQYQPGEPFSTGATSLLHTALLGLGWRLGLRGEGLIAGAILGGALMHLAAILAAARLGRRLGSARRSGSRARASASSTSASPRGGKNSDAQPRARPTGAWDG